MASLFNPQHDPERQQTLGSIVLCYRWEKGSSEGLNNLSRSQGVNLRDAVKTQANWFLNPVLSIYFFIFIFNWSKITCSAGHISEVCSVMRCAKCAHLYNCLPHQDANMFTAQEAPHASSLQVPATSDSGCLFLNFTEIELEGILFFCFVFITFILNIFWDSSCCDMYWYSPYQWFIHFYYWVVFHFINNITVCLSIVLLMGVWSLSSLGLLRIRLPWTFSYVCLFEERVFSFLLGNYLHVESLAPRVETCLT